MESSNPQQVKIEAWKAVGAAVVDEAVTKGFSPIYQSKKVAPHKPNRHERRRAAKLKRLDK